eukprot:TRINITY_DN7975_c0_g1_i1.p1 TRINITY_DN7975_c0_g1~~TRINITY_DN7975_c0_g1_i1.p1  ORF type:complete len:905 (+),score=321.25 TRINITY_DN7975_c0_g1_i1:48-2762(+)
MSQESNTGFIYRLEKKKWRYVFASLDLKNKILYYNKKEFEKEQWGPKMDQINLENCKTGLLTDLKELPTDPPPNSDKCQFFIEKDNKKLYFSAKNEREAAKWVNVLNFSKSRAPSNTANLNPSNITSFIQVISAMQKASEVSFNEVAQFNPKLQEFIMQILKSAVEESSSIKNEEAKKLVTQEVENFKNETKVFFQCLKDFKESENNEKRQSFIDQSKVLLKIDMKLKMALKRANTEGGDTSRRTTNRGDLPRPVLSKNNENNQDKTEKSNNQNNDNERPNTRTRTRMESNTPFPVTPVKNTTTPPVNNNPTTPPLPNNRGGLTSSQNLPTLNRINSPTVNEETPSTSSTNTPTTMGRTETRARRNSLLNNTNPVRPTFSTPPKPTPQETSTTPPKPLPQETKMTETTPTVTTTQPVERTRTINRGPTIAPPKPSDKQEKPPQEEGETLAQVCISITKAAKDAIHTMQALSQTLSLKITEKAKFLKEHLSTLKEETQKKEIISLMSNFQAAVKDLGGAIKSHIESQGKDPQTEANVDRMSKNLMRVDGKIKKILGNAKVHLSKKSSKIDINSMGNRVTPNVGSSNDISQYTMGGTMMNTSYPTPTINLEKRKQIIEQNKSNPKPVVQLDDLFERISNIKKKNISSTSPQNSPFPKRRLKVKEKKMQDHQDNNDNNETIIVAKSDPFQQSMIGIIVENDENPISLQPQSCDHLNNLEHQKLIENLISSVRDINLHLIPAKTFSKQKLLVDENVNEHVGDIIRSNFCSALASLLAYQFNTSSLRLWLFGNNHFWNFIEDAAMTSNVSQMTLLPLTKAIHDINDYEGSKNDPNMKFRSWVCAGLNKGLLGEWLTIFSNNRDCIEKFYTENSIWSDTQSIRELIKPINLLSTVPFVLGLVEERSNNDN